MTTKDAALTLGAVAAIPRFRAETSRARYSQTRMRVGAAEDVEVLERVCEEKADEMVHEHAACALERIAARDANLDD
ncbi:MAG: hypothetical protein H0X64_09070 [Gemmatimonadaceae bacterium]|nr:hypothetical protein [Gemmatimonadaceae bacterium]